jgi:hypothetical protein
MTIRTRNTPSLFFIIHSSWGVDRTLPLGKDRVMTEERLIEELSFPVYRRVSPGDAAE